MRRAGDVIASSFKQMGPIFKVRKHWVEIAGEVLASHTEPVLIKSKVLHILCDSPAWAQQISILSSALTAQVRKHTGIKLDKVEGRFGIVRSVPERKRSARNPVKLDIDIEDINRIQDPELARAMKSLIIPE